jgi:hypothetical protein
MNIKGLRHLGIRGLGLFLTLALALPAAWAAEEYKVTFDQWTKAKAFYDDPRPLMKDLYPNKIIPPADYAKLVFDVETMKKAWAEVVGFKAPDAVGKIAPEIKPGKYTYQDKEKYPGFKELFFPEWYERFNPGQPPFSGNVPEIEIIPTKQYYYALPVAEATRKYSGAVKQDEQGYMNYETYNSGFPFPRPSGLHKAIQVIYNWEKRYALPENYWALQIGRGYDKNLKQDFDASSDVWYLRLGGRCAIPPFGWYDGRAQKRRETRAFNFHQLSPRDSYGNVVNNTNFEGINDFDQYLLYIAMLRRVRKLSGTDTQDIAVGQDVIYEDFEGFSQKLSPTRFPYKYETIAEREFLFPTYTEDGSEWISKNDLTLRGVKFERRPCYVLQLTQLDKSYVYGRRLMYVYAEIFTIQAIFNYDQKDRLYRVLWPQWGFYPDMGCYYLQFSNGADLIDQHSMLFTQYFQPAPWITREHVSMQGVMKKGK